MKISIIAFSFTEYTARLALALAARGCEVQTHFREANAAGDLSPRLWAELERHTQIVLHPQLKRRESLFGGWRLHRALRKFGPDVVHVQESLPWPTVVARLLDFGKTPLVLTMHDVHAHSGADQKVRARDNRAFEFLRRKADGVIVHGPRAAEEALAAYARLDGRLRVVPHGTLGDVDSPRPAPEPGLFLFFGRVEAYKGLGILLEATRLLLARGHAFRVHIAGRGSDLDNRRAEIAALSCITVDERFIPAAEAESLLRRAEAIIMPYLDATQSGVLAYALNAGRGVVATRVGDLPDIVRDEDNGLLVPPNDPQALAAAMERMLVDEGLSEKLAAGALRTAQTALSWDRIAEMTVGVYRQAIASRRRAEFAQAERSGL